MLEDDLAALKVYDIGKPLVIEEIFPLGANYDAGKPENSLTGTLFTVNGMRLDNISVPAQQRRMRLWQR